VKLSEGIELFVSKKRNSGVAYKQPAAIFFHFKAQVGDVQLDEIRTQHVATFLEPNAVRPYTWHHKYNLLCRLFEHCSFLGMMSPLLMPDKRVRVRSSFVPYVYTHAEIRYLLEGTSKSQANQECALEARPFRIILFLLYVTGMTQGEVVRLKRRDFDLRRRTIAVCNPRSGRRRNIAVNADVCSVVRDYFKWRFGSNRADEYLFLKKSGRVVDEKSIQHYFARLVRRLRLGRRDGVTGWPRISDLRTSFAIHRITEWLRDEANMNQMLPALATYLGQFGLYSVERYLRLTPERFRKQLMSLSPQRSRRHWRDDEALMRFLASL
jgi:integrase